MNQDVHIEVRHTAELDDATLAAARALMYAAFDDMTEPDWDHALGGMHAVAWLDGAVIGHASVIQRRILVRDVPLRAGYVEAVAVAEAHRRTGVGSAVMRPIERIIRRAYDIGALGATDDAAAFYRGRGWLQWRGPASALTPEGRQPTPDEQGAIYVLPGAGPLDLDGEITCDWRDGDVW